MKGNTTNIFRKSKGQIVVEGQVSLNDENGNKIKHGKKFTLLGVINRKTCHFVMVHTKINPLIKVFQRF